MSKRSFFPAFVLFFGAMSLAACGGGGGGGAVSSSGLRPATVGSLPDEYGIYAIKQDGELVRLDGNREWELATWNQRSDFGPELQFVIFDRLLTTGTRPVAEMLGFYRVPTVRNEVAADGSMTPATDNFWIDVERREFEVPADFSPYLARPDAVVLRPRGRLASGLYAVRLVDGDYRRTARAGVRWPAVDKQAYARNFCVDRVHTDETTFRLCSEEPVGAGLRIALDPPRRERSMVGEVLAVEGSIENVSQRTRSVPPLLGTLLDEQGAPIRRWNFTSRLGTLAPGQSLTFRELLGDPPPAASRVRLTFAEAHTAAR